MANRINSYIHSHTYTHVYIHSHTSKIFSQKCSEIGFGFQNFDLSRKIQMAALKTIFFSVVISGYKKSLIEKMTFH